jgi:hypothetical protein
MATINDYRRALEAALDDPAYMWSTPLGELVLDEVKCSLKRDELPLLKAAIARLSQYQKAVDHPGGGCVPLAAAFVTFQPDMNIENTEHNHS